MNYKISDEDVSQEFLEKVLKDYKTGERKDPIMAGMAAALTPDDIDNLAFYYSSQNIGLTMKK